MSSTRTYSEWTSAASTVNPAATAFINGELVEAVDGRTVPKRNPANGQVLAEVADCGEEDVNRAVTVASRAFERGEWSRCAPRERKSVLKKFAHLISKNAEELALLDSLDGGKRIADTIQFDVPGSAAILEWYAEALDKMYGEIAPTAPGSLALITREPLGVVAAVVPWNYPLEMAVWKAAPALAAGNSLILKPAEESPLSAIRLAQLGTEAGLPEGVINVLPGPGPVVGRALGRHPGVNAVAFTGSTAVGKMFLNYASESTLKPVWLECGGKSANIVFDDVSNLDRVAEKICFGIFFNAGQVCSANSRLLVAKRIKSELLRRVQDRVLAMKVGDPLDPQTDMGPLVSPEHARRVTAGVQGAHSDGNLIVGGRLIEGMPAPTYMEPTIFDNVDPASFLANEEIFGPVLAVMEFDGEEEAIALANRSQYGLAASVWTDSLRRAHRVASRLRVGTVSVNTVDALDVTTPFGGFAESGYGRDLSLHAFDKFSDLKTTWIDWSEYGD